MPTTVTEERSSRTSSTTGGFMGTPLNTSRLNGKGGYTPSPGPGTPAHAAAAILETREREKRDLQDLNDRFASYIEKVRFLEAQNRKLAADLEALRNRKGSDTSSIRTMYEGEISEAKKLIDDTMKSKGDIERQISRLDKEVEEYRKRFEDAMRGQDQDKVKIEDLNNQLAKSDAEIALLRRKIELLEEEVMRLKKENMRLQAELTKARSDLDRETLNRIDYQNQVQTLLEEIEFLRRVHDQEIKELQLMAVRDTTAENREFFKNELASAIRDIRTEYDQITVQNKTDMESWYKLKVQEVQTGALRQGKEKQYQVEETKRIRTQLNDLRAKMSELESKNRLLLKQVEDLTDQEQNDKFSYEAQLRDKDEQIEKMYKEVEALMVELQMLLDAKQNLDNEIVVYRQYLDGEGNNAGLRQLVEQVVQTHSSSRGQIDERVGITREETHNKSFQRSAKGNVNIAEVSQDGRYITLENISRDKEEDMSEWRLKQRINGGKKEIVFTLPAKFSLKGGKSTKVWAKAAGGVNSPPDQLVFNGEDSWGIGSNVETILSNKKGEERATHIQRAN